VCPNIVYDDIAPAYARHRQAQAFVVETLRRLHALSPGGLILELGCGTGAYITALAQSGSCTHFAMDPSRRMLAQAPRGARVAFVQGHADCLPFSDRCVDMIFSVNVIHHIEDVGPCFREASRVLKPGGVLCTATDSKSIIEGRKPLSRYWPATIPVELARYHAIEELRDAMTVVGFRSIEEWQGQSEFTVSDSGPYRDKAFSCLQLISEEDFTRGLLAMEADLRTGPVEANSELAFVWGRQP
jgi:ubiquinone/menaquinone biosynthesis C-methylase UbiE